MQYTIPQLRDMLRHAKTVEEIKESSYGKDD